MNDLQKTISDNSLVLVDFWAQWCMPCRMMTPIVESIEKEYAGKLAVAKVDVDQNPDLATEHEVVSVPTFLIFKDGQLKERFSGGMPKAKVEEMIKRLL